MKLTNETIRLIKHYASHAEALSVAGGEPQIHDPLVLHTITASEAVLLAADLIGRSDFAVLSTNITYDGRCIDVVGDVTTSSGNEHVAAVRFTW